MKELLVYLCGPITGTSYEECTDWRDSVEKDFIVNCQNIKAINPMRGKAFLRHEKSIKDSYEDNSHCDKHAIFLRDRFDCLRADIVLANFLGAREVSIGSCFELAWAQKAGKLIIVVMEEAGNPHTHAFVRESATIIFNDLDEAVFWIMKNYGNIKEEQNGETEKEPRKFGRRGTF